MIFIASSSILILAELACKKNCCRLILKQQWHWFPRTTVRSCRDLPVGNHVSLCLYPLLRSNGARISLNINTLTFWTRNTPLYHYNNFTEGSWLIATRRPSHAMQWLYAFFKSAVYSDPISFISFIFSHVVWNTWNTVGLSSLISSLI